MSALSNAYELLVYDWLFRPGQAVTRHTSLFVGLFTAVTDAEAGTGTEVTGGGYARVDATSSMGAPASPGGNGANTVAITFPTPSANYPAPVTHYGLFTASSGGTAITGLIALAVPQTITNGGSPASFAIGALTASAA